MKIGFSSLSLFMTPLEEMLKIAINDGFDLMEILCEGPYLPRNLLKKENKEYLEIFESYDIEIMLHSPTIDLNPGSMNEGIREETKKQIKEALDLANLIGAVAITTHPGMVHRIEERIRNLAIDYSIETLKNCEKYSEEVGVKLSIENMPNNIKYLANSPEEHREIINEVGSSATIDWGHANTCAKSEDFLKLSKISYFHLNDNDGEKDQHLSLGEGMADFSKKFLENVDKGIIELNSYGNVLKGKEFLLKKIS
ncbi:MAG: sugar phosphate isomerase/epimerase [Methanobrevibacter sp.]|nr:sugar phosphate isomerase/epimerase [Methanobrevibacter sp.]